MTPETFTFTSYDKGFTQKPLTVTGWNARLKAIQTEAKIPIRTSHALRSTAISLTTPEHVHTVAQVGGWQTMTYLTIYHRSTLETKAKALSHIGARILESQSVQEDISSDEE